MVVCLAGILVGIGLNQNFAESFQSKCFVLFSEIQNMQRSRFLIGKKSCPVLKPDIGI